MKSPSDVKALNHTQIEQLCGEIRQFLIEKVSATGGHLASNLGVVELTVAIHRVFDTSRDRLVFDVGHQCYVHKALTGRQGMFETLRQFGGLSGFPKPCESNHDAFVAGHASNSVSVALGMARARTFRQEDYSVLALIGDGALTGGLSFEGLNNAGTSGEPLIVILNDNGMSIDPNVGALSRHLANLRNRPGYYAFKKWYRRIVGNGRFYRWSHNLKTRLKKTVLPGSTMFEDMGFSYLGPVDGHNVEQLTRMLTWAKEQKRPVLLHVKTIKGKGYGPAEANPGKFHGIGCFDAETGEVKKNGSESFSHVFGTELTAIAGENDRVCAITAAMLDGTGLAHFAGTYPQRCFDVGIAEGHAVAMSAGMAKQGLIPVFAVYSTFLQRSFDMLIHDVSLQRLHVVLGIDRAGLVGADGETHHGCFDPMYLSQIPSMTVYCPSSFAELRMMLRRAILEIKGPVAVRYPRGGEAGYTACCGEEDFTELRRGSDGTLVAYGIMINEALQAAERLKERGISVRVLKLNRIVPLDAITAAELLGSEKRLMVIEDCLQNGCVGQRLAALLAETGHVPQKLILRNLGDRIPQQGKTEELYRVYHLDAESIADTMEEACHE